MIDVEHVSMRFNLGSDKVNTLKEYFIKKVKRELKREEFWALKDVSFSVKPGEVLGLVGQNGAGKSTMLKVVAGVMKPTKGYAVCHGIVAPMIELGAGFDMDLSARENVFLNGAILGFKKRFLMDRYDEIVDFAELGPFMDVPVRNFSSGMIARLAFSVATLVSPQILLIDEILSVGDPPFQEKSEQKIISMINSGVAVIFVSHSMDALKKICSKVLWIEHGEMKMIGKVDQVIDAYMENWH